MKYILKETGEEIKVGQTIKTKQKVVIPTFGEIETLIMFTLDEEDIKELVKNGKVIEEEELNNKQLYELAFYSIAKKMSLDSINLHKILASLYKVNKWTVIQLFLKEIAIILDKKYEDHISKSEHIYAISPQDELIHEINKDTIKSYTNFPAFRNMKDASIALSIIKNYINE